MRPLAALVRRVPALLALLMAAGCGSSPSGTHANGEGHHNEVRVAAAADLKFALDEVVTDFRQQHPDIDVKVSYGSSGNFFAQLGNRAPFDVFLSADRDYVRQLIADGLAAERDEFVYAIGHLVVWVPHDSKLDLKKDGVLVLLDPSVQKIAIANPRFAPTAVPPRPRSRSWICTTQSVTNSCWATISRRRHNSWSPGRRTSVSSRCHSPWRRR